MRRRWVEHERGEFPWRDLFRGRMLDVGCSDDKLPFETCIGLDFNAGEGVDYLGDANKLSSYFDPQSFDLLHGSQILEHLHDPANALRDWLTLVKPGGHLIATVPDLVAYEGLRWPSPWNGDHKATFSMIYRGSFAPIHIHIPTLLAELQGVEVLLARFVDTNYSYAVGTSKDQTFVESDMVECWNEIVLRKI